MAMLVITRRYFFVTSKENRKVMYQDVDPFCRMWLFYFSWVLYLEQRLNILGIHGQVTQFMANIYGHQLQWGEWLWTARFWGVLYVPNFAQIHISKKRWLQHTFTLWWTNIAMENH